LEKKVTVGENFDGAGPGRDAEAIIRILLNCELYEKTRLGVPFCFLSS